MAGDAGIPTTSVAEALRVRAPHFAFMQAMWLLRRAYGDAPEPGFQGPPSEEFVRLRPSASLAFPPGEIEDFTDDSPTPPARRLTSTFLGLYGAHSPLPNFYSELVLQRIADDDNHALRAFLDIFNHRLLSLLYRGLLKYRGHLLFERHARDECSWRLFALSGFDQSEARPQAGVPAPMLLRFAGLWSQSPRSASAVGAILRTLLHPLPVRIAQCVPRWVYLRDDQRTRLGAHACRLGDDCTIGARVPDCTGKFRIQVGPVNLETYRRFLPGQQLLDTVRRLAGLAASDALAHDVEITLDRGDTAHLGVRLGQEGALGWTAGFFERSTTEVAITFS